MKNKSRSAYTLAEILIFAGILSLMAVGMTSIITSLSRVSQRNTANSEVTQQSQELLQTIQYQVERSSLIELASESTTSTLKLRQVSSTEDPTYIYLSGSTAYLKQTDGGSPQALTSNKVSVSNLVFTKHSTSPGHDSVSVSFTMAYNSTNPQSQFSQTLQSGFVRVSAATFDSDIVPSTGNTFKIGLTSGDWQSINNTIYFNASSVGIGITQPQKTLDVNGSIRSASGHFITNNPNGGLVLDAGSSTTGSAGIWFRSDNVTGDESSYNNLMFINASSGNVGIGTTNPAYKLDVGGVIRSTGDIYITKGSSPFLGSTDATDLRLGTGLTEQMRITSGGNVGIGTTNPGQKLEVNGNIRASGETIGTLGSGYAQFRAISGNYGAFIRNDGSDTYLLLTNSGDQYGQWNSLRPMRVNNASGWVSFQSGIVIENRTSDPASPITGQMWLRTDL